MRELNKKLAEWAEIEILGIQRTRVVGSLWGEIDLTGQAVYPNETVARKLCDFPNDLPACFKYLVPKIAVSQELTVTFHRCHGAIWSCILTTHSGDIAMEACKHKNPATALCIAIEQLIDGVRPKPIMTVEETHREQLRCMPDPLINKCALCMWSGSVCSACLSMASRGMPYAYYERRVG